MFDSSNTKLLKRAISSSSKIDVDAFYKMQGAFEGMGIKTFFEKILDQPYENEETVAFKMVLLLHILRIRTSKYNSMNIVYFQKGLSSIINPWVESLRNWEKKNTSTDTKVAPFWTYIVPYARQMQEGLSANMDWENFLTCQWKLKEPFNRLFAWQSNENQNFTSCVIIIKALIPYLNGINFFTNKLMNIPKNKFSVITSAAAELLVIESSMLCSSLSLIMTFCILLCYPDEILQPLKDIKLDGGPLFNEAVEQISQAIKNTPCNQTELQTRVADELVDMKDTFMKMIEEQKRIVKCALDKLEWTFCRRDNLSSEYFCAPQLFDDLMFLSINSPTHSNRTPSQLKPITKTYSNDMTEKLGYSSKSDVDTHSQDKSTPTHSDNKENHVNVSNQRGVKGVNVKTPQPVVITKKTTPITKQYVYVEPKAICSPIRQTKVDRNVHTPTTIEVTKQNNTMTPNYPLNDYEYTHNNNNQEHSVVESSHKKSSLPSFKPLNLHTSKNITKGGITTSPTSTVATPTKSNPDFENTPSNEILNISQDRHISMSSTDHEVELVNIPDNDPMIIQPPPLHTPSSRTSRINPLNISPPPIKQPQHIYQNRSPVSTRRSSKSPLQPRKQSPINYTPSIQQQSPQQSQQQPNLQQTPQSPYHGHPYHPRYPPQQPNQQHTHTKLQAYQDVDTSILKSLEVNPTEITIVGEVGTGATAIVYKGKWRRTDIAIKKLKVDVSKDVANEFFKELAIMARLRHPNLVLLMGVISTQKPYRVVTEFCSGGTLFDILYKHRMRLSWQQKIKIALDIAKGCTYLHASEPQILHRDLKSLNILLSQPLKSFKDLPTVKVSDFGMSKFRKAADNLNTGMAGTFQWMAPEVMHNAPYDEKVDVYSFGIVLYEIVTGRVPYDEQHHQNGLTTAMAVANGLRPNLQLIPNECPPAIRGLMITCWDSDPRRRPTFSQIVDRLSNIPIY